MTDLCILFLTENKTERAEVEVLLPESDQSFHYRPECFQFMENRIGRKYAGMKDQVKEFISGCSTRWKLIQIFDSGPE
jgi:hypothetical protein